MNLTEDRIIPYPPKSQLKSITITLSADEVGYIKSFVELVTNPGCRELYVIRGSSTLYELVRRIKNVEL